MNKDRIFKGATRPAMMMGVPIVPFIVVTGISIIAAMWSLVLFGPVVAASIMVVLVFVMLIFRVMTKQDDQRLNQYWMFLTSWPHRRRNKAHWNAHGASPTDYKKRKLM